MIFSWKKLASSSRPASSPTRRRSKRMAFSWDGLEERKVLSHFGGPHNINAAAQFGSFHANTGSGGTTTTSTALHAANQTLREDVQAVEANSSTTVGQLTAIRTAFQTLNTDGLTPSSHPALTSFENSLVTSFASGTTLTGNATLLSQFEALYTSSPTAQQTTDLTTAYNALAAAVTSSGITQANITTIDADYAAVLAAESSTSTATYPYFNLVTGGGPGGFGGHGGFGGPGGSC